MIKIKNLNFLQEFKMLIQVSKQSPSLIYIQSRLLTQGFLQNSRAKSNESIESNVNNINSLINEREKINQLLVEFDYFGDKECQNNWLKTSRGYQIEHASISTQFPEEGDILNQIVSSIDPITIAQTQLNILVETLDKLK